MTNAQTSLLRELLDSAMPHVAITPTAFDAVAMSSMEYRRAILAELQGYNPQLQSDL